MQFKKQVGRTNVTAGSNRANRPCLDGSRTRQVVDRRQSHDFQAGKGRQNSVVPHRLLCTIRPEDSRTMAAEDVNERRLFADPKKWRIDNRFQWFKTKANSADL